MSDIAIFLFGVLVSGIVVAACGFLLWGVANEPDGSPYSKRPEAKTFAAPPRPVPERKG